MTTVEVVCYKYKPLRNGELPLKIRVTKDRKVRYVSLGVSTKPEHWDFKKNQPKADCPNREYIEKLIANRISAIKVEKPRAIAPLRQVRLTPDDKIELILCV
ncbi:Arm DNA-binding domain-containing protein [Paramuribaculum intestinale]|uniref:Arm DNA-binding domain-containing protein n=1 Tax=Paramuribaculum intestinale TaxID=2094151 RepID=UPI0025A5B7C2|nr:Arm DNA-binding domain-containing protein [Paramuribaculum intestinale]